jgi:hypothetical protein
MEYIVDLLGLWEIQLIGYISKKSCYDKEPQNLGDNFWHFLSFMPSP